MDRRPPQGSSLLALLLAVPLAVACSRRGPDFREVRNLGSDTMLEVAGAWAEAYDGVQSDVVVSVSGGGSGTGIAALIAGTVDLANSSRRLKQAELDAARRAGQEPVEHRVGYDAIAIYVHRDNPLQSITVAQLRSLFGDGGKLSRWSDIGVDLGEPKLDPVILCSRQNNSGTYEYFREAVLGGSKGRFKAECLNLNGSKDVVEFCSRTPSAIGYSGLAYQTDEVRVLPVVKDEGRPAVMPSTATVLDRSYPIARQLYMYTRGQPQGATAAYLEWICSDAGQRVLQDHGYPPLRRL